MKPFSITFAGYLRHSGRDLFKFCRFRISQGELHFPINIAMTEPAFYSLRVNEEDAKRALVEMVFLKIGIREMVTHTAGWNGLICLCAGDSLRKRDGTSGANAGL